MGRRLILLKASVAMGELSVRIVVPMAMKKLVACVSTCDRVPRFAHTQTWLPSPSCTVPVSAAFHLDQGQSARCW
jgi:hypothetical protein